MVVALLGGTCLLADRGADHLGEDNADDHPGGRKCPPRQLPWDCAATARPVRPWVGTTLQGAPVTQAVQVAPLGRMSSEGATATWHERWSGPLGPRVVTR